MAQTSTQPTGCASRNRNAPLIPRASAGARKNVSVLMIGPAMDEVLASLQYLKRVRAEGGSVWRAFWGLKTR